MSLENCHQIAWTDFVRGSVAKEDPFKFMEVREIGTKVGFLESLEVGEWKVWDICLSIREEG